MEFAFFVDKTLETDIICGNFMKVHLFDRKAREVDFNREDRSRKTFLNIRELREKDDC